jgi:hypothetical protein
VNETSWSDVKHWAPLVGRWNLSAEKLYYEGDSLPQNNIPYGLAISNERFRDGFIKAIVQFQPLVSQDQIGSVGVVLGYNSETGAYLVAGLGAFNTAYSIWEFLPGQGWFNRKSAGLISNLRISQDYSLEVVQKGQRISLSVDSVPVIECLLSQPLSGNQIGLYAMTKSPIIFRNIQVNRKQPLAFVAMQFGEPYDTIYRTVIRPKAQALGFEVIRIDEINKPGIIFHDIQRKIEDAKVVIAEITAPNQNVFYEIGYAHALNKPTILLAQRGKDLPFDIRSYRVIFYDDSIGGKPHVEKTLREHLHSILQDL